MEYLQHFSYPYFKIYHRGEEGGLNFCDGLNLFSFRAEIFWFCSGCPKQFWHELYMKKPNLSLCRCLAIRATYCFYCVVPATSSSISIHSCFDLGDVCLPKKGLRQSLKIVHRFHFTSALRRMSVVTSIQTGDSSVSNFLVTCKGAPETLKGMVSYLCASHWLVLHL